jgi:uncharacterized protein (DUF934 family)
MRRILKRRELVEDQWLYLGEDGTTEAANGTATSNAPALVVPFAEFRTNAARWREYPGPLGVRLSPGDKVEDLAQDIQRLSLIAAEFPGPGEGRGYTQARLLRSRLHFTGELRAVGAGVKQDLLFSMSRCGFDSFDLAPGQKVEEALKALDRYSVAYQPGQPVPSITQQRYASTLR